MKVSGMERESEDQSTKVVTGVLGMTWSGVVCQRGLSQEPDSALISTLGPFGLGGKVHQLRRNSRGPGHRGDLEFGKRMQKVLEKNAHCSGLRPPHPWSGR